MLCFLILVGLSVLLQLIFGSLLAVCVVGFFCNINETDDIFCSYSGYEYKHIFIYSKVTGI